MMPLHRNDKKEEILTKRLQNDRLKRQKNKKALQKEGLNITYSFIPLYLLSLQTIYGIAGIAPSVTVDDPSDLQRYCSLPLAPVLYA